MYKYKYSVILPVYNVSEFLNKSLESLQKQTLRDIEIICVNDCSTDDSLSILEDFATQDNRIKIINLPQNCGQGLARNIALKQVEGEYIAFVDPDDWVELEMLETLYKIAKEKDCELVEFNHYVHNEIRGYRKIYKNRQVKYIKQKKFNHSDMSKDYPFVAVTSPWNKIYKSDFIRKNNIQFWEGRFGEDQIFSIKARLLAKSIYYCDKPLYNYRIRANSSLNKLNKDSLNRPSQMKDVKDFLVAAGLYEEYKNAYIYFAANSLAYCYNRLLDEWVFEYEKSIQELIDNEVSSKIKKIKTKKYDSWPRKIFSVHNELEKGVKYKVVTILGITIKNRY